MPSDSNYSAVTKHRRPLASNLGRPSVLDIVDDQWAADKLSDDEVEVGRHELDACGLEEGELDADAIVVSPSGTSSSATNSAERRRREEGWNDLGLDQLDTGVTPTAVASRTATHQG